MNRTVRNRLFISTILSVALALAIVAARAQNPPQAAPPAAGAGQNGAPAAPKTASQQFKNIQILKDVPADQIIPAMQFIGASLGVECEYCHVERAFDKDDKKPKVTARKMMEMMFNINKENFEDHREVTCFTCHQGSAHPASIPAVGVQEKTAEMMEDDAASEAAKPAAESLLDKYLAAVGGAEAVKKVTSRVEKGSLTGFRDQTSPIEIFAKAPDKRVSVVHMKEGESVTAYNGKVGWLSVPGRVHMMNTGESAGARLDADMEFAANVKALYPKWVTMPGEKIDGHETWLVIGHKEGAPPLKLYFDQKSNLLVRMIRYTDSPLGYNPTQIDYADYRDSGGVKIPYRWTISRPGNKFTVQVEEVQQNVPVDDAKFVPPPPPAAAPAAH
jgi:photosynthetic reaction center cytochrome c subunit